MRLKSISLDAAIVGGTGGALLFAQAELPTSTTWQVAAFGLASLAVKLAFEVIARRDAAIVENRSLKAELEYHRTRAALLAATAPPEPRP